MSPRSTPRFGGADGESLIGENSVADMMVCRPISMHGSVNTTRRGHTKAVVLRQDNQCKPSLTMGKMIAA